MVDTYPTLLQPTPRRSYDLTPTSSNSSAPPSPSQAPDDSSLDETGAFNEKASRTRSILNLTSSTLFGIYTPSASGIDSNKSEPSTPLDNGSQTPTKASLDSSRSARVGVYASPSPLTADVILPQHSQHLGSRGKLVLLGERTILLFLFGVAYGIIISHLHHNQQVVPVQVDLRGIEHDSWRYLLGWGGVGVALGGMLPWVDVLWEEVLGYSRDVFASSPPLERPVSPNANDNKVERPASGTGSDLGADWNPVVRSVGAFIGIAFAIVRSTKFYPCIRADIFCSANSLGNPLPKSP